MPNLRYRAVLLAVVVGAFAATPASAAVRYASPTGTGPAATCPAIDPCGIANAVNSTYTFNGDEVILAPGDYVSPPELDILDGVDVHGQGTPSDTRIVSTANVAVYLGNVGAKLRNVEIAHSTGILGAAYVSSGTVERVIAQSDSANACVVFNATIRDSICASSRSGGGGVFLNISGGTYSIVLRNVTAIGSGATNSYGLYAGASSGATVSYDAKSVIARGTTYDVYASANGVGDSSTVTFDHSNYQNVFTAGAGATVTATSANNNQTAVPVFVNAAGGDYHQAVGSPTIDAGAVDGSSGATDVDGETRVQGSAADIGGDEFEVPPLAPSITSPVSGASTNDTTPTVSGTAEANSTVAVFADGNPAGTTSADGTGVWSLDISSVLTAGDHSITATATDAALTTSPASTAVSLTVDLSAPLAPSIVSPADGSATGDTTPTISGTAEPNSTVAVFADGNPAGTTSADGTGAWSLDISPALSEGAFAVTATATDAANNTSPDSSAVSLTVDVTAPSVSITAPANGSMTNDGTPQIAFSVTETNPNASECRVDGGAWFTCASNDSLAALADGSHTLDVRHTDIVGNIGSSSTTFTVDLTAPSVSITAPANGSTTNDNTPQVTFSVTETNPNTSECRVDGGAWFACASNDSLAALADGSHTLDVRHTDIVGNIGSSSTTFTVDAAVPPTPGPGSTPADATAPQTTIRKHPKRKSAKRRAKFTFTASEANSTFKCKLDKRAFAPCKSPFVKRVRPGKHILRVVATDAAGNADKTPAIFRWKVLAR